MVLSKIRKSKAFPHGEFTKRQVREANVFMYDIFWFTYGGRRFGFEVDDIVKLRNNSNKELEKEIRKMDKKRK